MTEFHLTLALNHATHPSDQSISMPNQYLSMSWCVTGKLYISLRFRVQSNLSHETKNFPIQREAEHWSFVFFQNVNKKLGNGVKIRNELFFSRCQDTQWCWVTCGEHHHPQEQFPPNKNYASEVWNQKHKAQRQTFRHTFVAKGGKYGRSHQQLLYNSYMSLQPNRISIWSSFFPMNRNPLLFFTHPNTVWLCLHHFWKWKNSPMMRADDTRNRLKNLTKYWKHRPTRRQRGKIK